MNIMKIGKKIEIETLNLKFTTERLLLAEEQLKEGSDDLHFRLSHFRKRVVEKDKDKYDQFFFGAKFKDNNEQTQKQPGKIILHKELKKLPTLHLKKDQWLKKIYRKIVSSTHPDKFANFPVENLKHKYLELYRRTVDAWNQNEDDQILLCAYESNIKVDNPKALPILQTGQNQKNNRIQDIHKLLAYQWHHVPEKDKSKTLESYLEKLGYSFTSEEVKNVVNLARKRKVGTRPVNFIKIKNVK